MSVTALLSPELLFAPLAYLLGSISSAIIVCRLMDLPDPRSQGSNNPGATNVLRIGGKKAAALTLAGDLLKGLIPVLVANFAGVDDRILALTGIAAFLGHLYPVFFGFRGGKGVATALGVLFGIHWMAGVIVAGLWLLVAKGLKISSLSALISMGLSPVVVWFVLQSPPLLVMQVLLTVLLFWRHRSNIRNLLTGTEDRINENDKATGTSDSSTTK